MKFRLWNEISKIKEGTGIWACAFDYDVEKQRFRLRKEPVKGEIRNRKFYQYKSGSCLLQQTGVDKYSRVYADTQKECQELYIEEMNGKIEYLYSCVKMIEEEKNKFTKV